MIDAAGLRELRERRGDRMIVLQVVWDGSPASMAAPSIPGVARVDLARDLAGPAVPGGARMPLPSHADLTARLRAWGIDAESTVVVADDVDGRLAARAWWVLRYAGLEDVRVLDGPIVDREAPPTREGTATARFGGMPTIDATDVPRVAREGLLLDARQPVRFTGEVEPVDARAGHIPGAVSAPVGSDVVGLARDASEIAVYCGSGVAAARQILALHDAGIGAALYVGSWSEWAGRPELPIAVGPNRG